MSFILKNENVVVNVKLTTIGRKQLASGNLNFSSWAVGDSEIDYQFAENTDYDISNSIILRPKDKYPVLKYPILPNEDSETPFTPITNIVPVETRIRNTAKERGFFTGNTINGFTANTTSKYVIQNNLKIDINEVTGGTIVQIKQDTGFTFYQEPFIGDLLFVQWVNPSYTGLTVNGVINKNTPLPHLWYKIQNKTGSINNDDLIVTLDRELPNFNNEGIGLSAKCLLYPGFDSINEFYGSGETTFYWNENTLAFNSNCNISNDDVPVWNMNIVYTENLAGVLTSYENISNYGSIDYTGFKNYVSQTFDNPSKKSIGIIHYTNFSINNYYGEEFYDNTPILELPTVIWHRSTGNTIGLTLKCDTTPQTSIPAINGNNLNTTYYNLIDDTGFVVGKCFINLKIFVIEDEELIAAMSYKSNRNWSLPSLTFAGMTVPINNIRPNIFTTVNQKLYLTYLFESTSGYDENLSYGYSNILPCQNYLEITPEISNNILTNNQVPLWTIDANQLKYVANNFSEGIGVVYDKFKLLYQLVPSTSQRPDPTQWKEIDYTTKLNGFNTWSGNSIPVNTVFSSINPLIYNLNNNDLTGGTPFDLSEYIDIPLLNQPDNLQFGDEVFFYGNIKTDISATVFKTKIIISLPFNSYNTSQNPTWELSNQSVYVSEIGIYDGIGNLVAIGKMSYPFEKKSNQIRVVEVSLDF